MPGDGGITLPRRRGRSGWAVALGLRVVFVDPLRHVRCRRQIDGAGEHLENHLPAVVDPFRPRLYLHARLDHPRAGRRQHTRAFDLDDAYATDIHRMQRLEKAERGNLDADGSTGGKNRRAFPNADGLAVYDELHADAGSLGARELHKWRRHHRRGGHGRVAPLAGPNTSSRWIADSTAA